MPEDVEEYIDENGMRVRRIVGRTITTRTIKKEDEGVQPVEVTFPVAPSEDESPEEVEEYIDENGVRVRRTITTPTIKKEHQGTEPVKVTFPVAPSEDESPEEVEEYINENGMRVRRIVKRTITTTTIEKEDQGIEAVKVTLPVAPSEDQSPAEVEEYIDENGMRVRRIVRRTITATTIKKEDEGIEPVEVTFPVAASEDESPEEVEEYIDENGMLVRRIERRTITTTTIEKEDQGIEPVEVTFPVAPSEDESSEEVEEYIDENGVLVRRILRRTITSTTIKKEDQGIEPVEVPFPVAQSEDESPEEVEEYIDENGMRVRRIVKRTITTTTIKKEDQGIEPVEVTFPVAPSAHESPEEVEEYIDENGMRVRRIVRRTITSTTIKKEDQGIEPVEVTFPLAPSEHESPEEVEEYIDENGMQVRRIVRRTITTTTIKKEDQGIEPVEVTFPVAPSEDESPEEVEEYIDENGVRVRRTITSTTIKKEDQGIEPVEVTFPVAPSEHESPEEVEKYIDDNGMRVRRIVKRTITTTTIKKKDEGIEPVEVTFPVTPSAHESPEVVEEYIDENDMQVRRTVRPTITATTMKKEDQGIEPVEVTFPVAPSEDESPEEVEEYIDESGMRLRGIVKRTITTTTIKKEDQGIEPVQVTFPVAPSEDESPEEVEEYIDENDVQVRRIVRRTITATTMKKEDQGIEPVEVPFPVAPSEDESPEVVEEYMDENGMQVRRTVRRTITTTTIKKEDQGIEPVEIPFPEAPSEDESPEEIEEYIDENGMRVRRIVRRTITTTTMKKEDQGIEPVEVTFPVAPSEDESPEEVEEYIDENGMRVRNIVKRTITTTTIKKEDQGIEPVEVTFPVAPSEDESPEEVEEYIDENGVCVRRIVRRTITTTTIKKEDQGIEHVEVPFPVAPSEDESPEAIEEYIDENGMRAKRIVKRTFTTTTTIKREDQDIEPVEIKFPVAPSEDESPEDVEEYTDENGVRVRRVVRRTITTATIKREGQQIQPLQVKFPVAASEDESPEELEEYVDENGVRVRRIERRTISTRSIIRTSVDETKDGPGAKTFESGAPVYLVPSVQTREVVLPEWMEGSESASEEPRQPSEDISFLVLPSQPRPESKGDLDREDVMEKVTSTTLNREIVIPEIDRMEDESPEEVEEYVDENGVRVKRIVRRTFTTTTIKREGQRTEPVEDQFPVAPSESETPEEVEEFVDENGVRVRRIVRRTITTRSVIRTSVDEANDGPGAKTFESATPVYLDSDDVVPSVQTREAVLPEWMEDTEPASEKPRHPSEDISFLILPSQPRDTESKEDLDREDVMERVTSTTLNRETVIPEIEGMEDESPHEVEEYVDENGVRVRQIARRTITTTSIRKEGQRAEPVEIKFPVISPGDDAEEEVEEYVDENGVCVRRIVKRTITTTTTIRRQGHELEPMAVELPIEDRQSISPDEFVEEYVNENGVTVKRIVERSTTTNIQRRVFSDEGVDESRMPVGIYQVTEEVAPRKEMATVEATTPETVLFSQMQALSPRRESIPYETTVVQRYLVIIETLYQYVLEHKSMIFIYSSRYMQFNFVLENFLQWMLVTLKTLSWMRPVSWKVDEIKDQLQQIKVFLSLSV